MDTMTLGLFHTQESVENAINELSRHGFSSKEILIAMQDQGKAKKVAKTTGAYVAEGLLVGLIELGLSQDEVLMYETDIKTGAILLGIPTTDISNTIRQILQKHKASQIRSVKRGGEKV